MEPKFINLNEENLANEHLCCIIRSKKPHPGVEEKRKWLSQRIKEGHVFRKLNIKGCAFIEYAPLETAWVPVMGDNFYYIYCLWVQGEPKGCGYGRELMEYCINDAIQKQKSGICMLGAEKQKAWLSNQDFAKKFGFKVTDTTKQGYQLLTLSFDVSLPYFAPNAKKEYIENKNLTLYYDMQCPYILQKTDIIKEYCTQNNISADFIKIDTLKAAKELPCVFNNFALFCNGKFQTVNVLDITALERILKKEKIIF